MENIQDTACGRMSSGLYPPTKETTSNLSSKQLSELKKRGSRCLRLKITDGQNRTYIWETDGAWLTEFSTINTGVSPNERARIYLVADFAGESAGEVLFKSEGVSGYTPQGFRAWQGTDGGAEESTGTSGERSDNGSGVLCVNTQGNSGVGITEDKALALVAQDHGNHPAVLHAAGFSTEHSAKARSIGYEEEVSPTLRAGVIPAALSVENHPTDGRIKIREDGKCQTLCGRAGTGGNNVPLVAEYFTPFVKGTRPHSAAEGQTWKSGEVANTLNTFDVGESRCNELVVEKP